MIKKHFLNLKVKVIPYLDQAIISMGNFLIGIFIYRFLGLIDFATFSIIWFISHLINSLQMSAIINFMNSSYKEDGKIFLYTTLFYSEIIFSLIICIFISIFLFAFADYMGVNNLNNLTLIFFYFIFQLNNFIKRIFYHNNLYKITIINNTIIYFGSIISIFCLDYYEIFSLQIFMNFFSIIVLFSTLLFFNKFLSFINISKRKFEHFKSIWNYSKWLICSSCSDFFCLNLWQINLAANISPAILGLFRACYSIASFINIFYLAFENIYPKKFSRFIKESNVNKKEIMHYINSFLFNFFKVAIPLLLLVFFFSKDIFNLIYGDLDISEHQTILAASFVIILISVAKFPVYFTIRSYNKTKIIFFGSFAGALFSVMLSEIMITEFGVNGFIFGTIVNQIIITYLPFIILFKKYLK